MEKRSVRTFDQYITEISLIVTLCNQYNKVSSLESSQLKYTDGIAK